MDASEVVSSSSTRRLFQLRPPVARRSLEKGEVERVKRWLRSRCIYLAADPNYGKQARDMIEKTEAGEKKAAIKQLARYWKWARALDTSCIDCIASASFQMDLSATVSDSSIA